MNKRASAVMATAAVMMAPGHNGMMQSVATSPETRRHREEAKRVGAEQRKDKATAKRERRRLRNQEIAKLEKDGLVVGRVTLQARAAEQEVKHKQKTALGARNR